MAVSVFVCFCQTRCEERWKEGEVEKGVVVEQERESGESKLRQMTYAETREPAMNNSNPASVEQQQQQQQQ